MANKSAGDLITSPQTLTANWADLGEPVTSIEYSFFAAVLDLDINDSEDVQIRFRALHEIGGTERVIPLKTIKKDKVALRDFYYELDDDVDQGIVVETEIDKVIHFVQVQVKAGTLGATAGIITNALYHQGYRQ